MSGYVYVGNRFKVALREPVKSNEDIIFDVVPHSGDNPQSFQGVAEDVIELLENKFDFAFDEDVIDSILLYEEEMWNARVRGSNDNGRIYSV